MDGNICSKTHGNPTLHTLLGIVYLSKGVPLIGDTEMEWHCDMLIY